MTGENRSTQRKPVPGPLRLIQIPIGVTRDQTQEITGKGPSAWVTAWPDRSKNRRQTWHFWVLRARKIILTLKPQMWLHKALQRLKDSRQQQKYFHVQEILWVSLKDWFHFSHTICQMTELGQECKVFHTIFW